jgi:PhnB protein
MTLLNPYLTFSGNCREAMTFYKECLGGKLTLQTIGESPMADQMPSQMKDSILHATLTMDRLIILATDCVPDNGLIKGNGVSLCLNFNSDGEIRTCYASLAAGGKTTQPLENTFWGAIFGGLTDKFGNHWLLNFDKNKK